MNWVLVPVVAKDVGNREILEPGDRGQSAAHEERYFLPLVDESGKHSN
jgi:hypothetical protein